MSKRKTVLAIFSRSPYDGTDVTWNGLRLVEALVSAGVDVHSFLINDSVDLARDAAVPPEGYFDLGEMLKKLISRGVPVKACGSCKARCGVHRGEPYFAGVIEATMEELAAWVQEADTALTF